MKNKEIQRINKENSLLLRYKDSRIDDKLLKKQVVKQCKKISQAFKGAIEEDDELEKDLLNQKEIILSEICLLEIMGDKLTIKQKCAITLRAKLMEANIKEKEFDPYFGISLVLHGARNTFIREAGRHCDVYCNMVESQNRANDVRRLYKNMVDTHHTRRVKLFKDTKTDKYYKLLLSQNEESKKHILLYRSYYEEAIKRKIEQQEALLREQENQNRKRNRRDSSKAERETSGSRARASIGRDTTPNKMISKNSMLQTNTSLSSMDSNLANLKQSTNGRNIKTP